MPKPGVMIYFDIIPAVQILSNEECGELFKLILLYSSNGDYIEPNGKVKLAWEFIKPSVDRDSQRYEEVSAQARHKVYIRECKRQKKKPLDFEEWRVSIDNQQLSTDNQQITADNSSYPTSTPISTSSPMTNTNSSIDTSTIPICGGKPNTEEESGKEKSKPSRHKYGEYQNVLLSDKDMEKLKSEFPNDWGERIERLSAYIASTGKKYKNHLATIRNWARNESKGGTNNGKYNGNKGNGKDSGESKYAGYEFGTTV